MFWRARGFGPRRCPTQSASITAGDTGGWIPITITTVPNWNGLSVPAQEQESARLERVVICSWTSPDGVTRYNELLAGRRADSLKSWLVRHAQIPGELVSVRGEGIGWGVLRQFGGSIRYAL